MNRYPIDGRRLYPLLLAGVLAFGACGREKGANPSDADAGAATSGPAGSARSAPDGTTLPAAPGAADRPFPDTSDRPTPGAAGGEIPPVVLFFGDSITAGSGVDPSEAYPAVLQRRADSLGVPAEMRGAGLPGETSAGGLRRVAWLARQRVDVLVVELGGNDGLRGIDPDDTRRNLVALIDSARAAWPGVRVVIAGMLIPPNIGHEFALRFRDVYPAVARETGSDLVPFLLEGVGGVEGMMQADGMHPTPRGHRRIADTLWPHVAAALDDLGG